MRSPESITANEDTRLVPMWSTIAAVAAFVLVEYYFWIVLPAQQNHHPPLGFRIYFNISWGLLAALYFLMVGYVSKDAPRRAMSARFWIALCFVMPGGIGAVLYFLLRQRRFRGARRAPRTCRAISTSARSATISLPPVADIASAPCARPTSFARAVVMSCPRTTCRRGCA